MTMKLADLQKATEVILKNLTEQGFDEVEISEDYYWVIDEKELYDPYKEPKSFTFGQLSSDFEDIQRIASGATPPIGYSLVWLSSLFKFIGEKHVG